MEILSGKQLEKDLKDDELVPILKSLNCDLSHKENSPNLSQVHLTEYKTLATELLKFTPRPSEEIQLYLSCCFSDILRIVAPKEIFTKTQVKFLFESITKAIFFLQDPSSALYPLTINLLQIISSISAASLAINHSLFPILAKYVENCLNFVATNCGISAEILITDNLRIIYEDLPEFTDNFLCPILVSLKTEHKKTPRYRISLSVLTIKNSGLRNAFSNFAESLFLQGKSSKTVSSSVLNERYEITYRLYKINHGYHECLINLFSRLSELMSSKKNEKLIKMVGKIAACKKSTLDSTHSHLFSEFLKLFESDQEDIRLIMIEFACKFCKNHKSKEIIVPVVIGAVAVRLKDTSDRVRSQALKGLMKISEFNELPKKTVAEICERVKDVKKYVRKSALEVMIRIYKDKWVDTRAHSRYKMIIGKIFSFLQNFGDVDEQLNAVDLLESIICESFNSEEQSKVFLCIFEDLDEDNRKILEALLECKSFWANYLLETLNSADSSSLEAFCANLKLPILNCNIKKTVSVTSGEVFESLKDTDNRKNIKKILETQNFSEKIDLLQNLKQALPQAAFFQLKSRCFNFIISPEHVTFYINTPETLPVISKSFPEYLEPHLLSIVTNLHTSAKRPELFATLSAFDVKKYDWEVKIQDEIVVLSKAGPYEEANAARKLLKNLKLDFITQLTEELLNSTPSLEQISIELLFLKQILKFWPSVAEKNKLLIKNFAYFVCENSEIPVPTKSLAIVLLHALVKYCGFFKQAIFVYIRKIGFNLESFYKKKVKKDQKLTNNEEFTLRVRCFKSLLGLLNISEMKSFLNCKTLTCFAYAAMSPVYMNSISSIIRKNIYDKLSIPPPLLSILALLLGSSEAKVAKDALLQVLKRMKQNSVERQDPEQAMRVQPEIYLPYVLYIIAKCKVSEKSYKGILQIYMKCLLLCENPDFGYLMYLLKQLRKFSIEGKTVKSDIWTPPSKNLELEKLCDEVSSIVALGGLGEGMMETQFKVLIPSTFFVKKTNLTSPDRIRCEVDEGSGLRRRGEETSPAKKEFNMFNSQTSPYH